MAAQEKLLAYAVGLDNKKKQEERATQPILPKPTLVAALSGGPNGPIELKPVALVATPVKAVPKTNAASKAISKSNNFDERFFLPASYNTPEDLRRADEIRRIVPRIIRAFPGRSTTSSQQRNAYFRPESIMGRAQALHAIENAIGKGQ